MICRSIFYLLFIFSFSSLAQDSVLSANEIGGTWIRVGEGCRLLSEAEMLMLPYNGGGNSARRRMMLSFSEDRFYARFHPSLRCEGSYKKKDSIDFQNDNLSKSCESVTEREGRLTYLPDEKIILNTEGSCLPTSNPWGCDGAVFKTIRVGSTLALTSEEFDWECGKTPFYIYFIPLPMM